MKLINKIILSTLIAANCYAQSTNTMKILSSLNLNYSTANRVCTIDSSKNVVSSSVTDTELGYLSGVTSGIQTQINSKVPTTTTISTTSPLTGGGDLSANRTISFSNQSANTVLAGPTSGGAAAPSFRSLVSSDIPSLSSLYVPLSGGTMTGALTTPQINISGGTAPFYMKWNSISSKYEIAASSDPMVWSTTSTEITGNSWKFSNPGVGTSYTFNGTGFTQTNSLNSLSSYWDSGLTTWKMDSSGPLTIQDSIGSNFYLGAEGTVSLNAIGSIGLITNGNITGNTNSGTFQIQDGTTGAKFSYDAAGNLSVSTGSSGGNVDQFTYGYYAHNFNSSGGDSFSIYNAFPALTQLNFNASGQVDLTAANGQFLNLSSGADTYLFAQNTGYDLHIMQDISLQDSTDFGQQPYFFKNRFGSNFSIGSDTAFSAISGGAQDNYSIGTGNSLGSLTTGTSNLSYGTSNLTQISDSSNAIAIGNHVLESAATANSILAVGSNVFQNATSINNALGIGASAGSGVTSISDALFIGTSAGSNATGADGSLFLGTSSGSYINGQLNIAIGAAAMVGDGGHIGSNSGSYNVYIGANTGLGLTTGSNNLVIGSGDGSYSLTTGSNNVFIGPNLKYANGTVDGYLTLKNALFGNNLTADGTTIPTNGRLGAFISNPSARFQIGAGTSSLAPFKLTSGTSLSSPEAGAMEFDGTSLFFTPSSTRYNILMNNLGLSGGQTVVGGTAASNNLTLSSTSNATKGKVILGSISAYDEANDRLGIGTTTPSARAHLVTNSIGAAASATSGLFLENTTQAVNGTQQYSPSIVFRGNGYKTNTTAGSQTVDWQMYVQPIQGSANPSSSFRLDLSTNGGAYANAMNINSSGTLTASSLSANSAIVNGSIQTSTTSTSSNFFVTGNTISGNQTSAQFLTGAATAQHIRTFFYGSNSTTLAIGSNYSAVNIARAPISTAASGTHAFLTNLAVNPIGTVTNAGASVTNTASFYIDGAGSGGTNNFAAYVNAGLTRVAPATTAGASLRIPSGTAPTSPAEGDIWNDGTNLKYYTGGRTHSLDKILTGSATLDFPNTSSNSSNDLTLTVTGAADGDPVAVGVPNACASLGGLYFAYVSAADTVTVRFHNTSGAGIDPPSATFKVTVSKQ